MSALQVCFVALAVCVILPGIGLVILLAFK